MISEMFDAPRWKGGPRICVTANLPSFPSKSDAEAYHEKYGSGRSIIRIGKCKTCGHWHYLSKKEKQ